VLTHHTQTHTHIYKHTEQVSAAVTFCTCVRKVSGSDFFCSSGSDRFVCGFSSAPDECRDCILVRPRPLPFASPPYSSVICLAVLTALWNEPPPPYFKYHNMNMYGLWRKTPRILQLGRHGGEWYRKLPCDICRFLFPHLSEFTIHSTLVTGSCIYEL
jgi:hypothetical protein